MLAGQGSRRSRASSSDVGRRPLRSLSALFNSINGRNPTRSAFTRWDLMHPPPTLRKSEADRPPRDLALSVLGDSQRAKVAAFEKELELAREALGRGILHYRYVIDVTCK